MRKPSGNRRGTVAPSRGRRRRHPTGRSDRPWEPSHAPPEPWYLARALRRSGPLTTIAVLTASAGLVSACGAGPRQDAQEPSGNFPVQISHASFPSQQRLSEHTHLVITVRNAGNRTIPDVVVTITDPPYGTSVQPFGTYFSMPGVAYHSRPVWIIDRPPGPCANSCLNGGFGSDVDADPHNWASGQLRPGATATFDWGVTAVRPGNYRIAYRVAAGLNGKARAKLQGGGIPQGEFEVAISSNPSHSYVSNGGQVVNSP